VTFDGTAMSVNDNSLQADVSGEIFLESILSHSASKFRITGGEILIGDTFYDFVFGKARILPMESQNSDSMLILGQIMDDQGNINTVRLSVTTSSLDDLGSEPIGLEINSPSKIAKQWTLVASGQLSLM
jgi:hypothetical protein